MDILGLLLMGLVVGAIGRLVVPGRHRLGLLGTMAVGVAGAFLGWAIGRGLVGNKFHNHPWIWAIIARRPSGGDATSCCSHELAIWLLWICLADSGDCALSAAITCG